MSNVRTENFLAILPSLQEGDMLVIAETEDFPSSILRIEEIGEDFISGMALFEESEEEEYGEIYEDYYHLIQQVIINLEETPVEE